MNQHFYCTHAAACVLACTASPAWSQPEFNARPFITVDVNNDPAQRTDVPTETEYIPGVVASENGLASFEALKAQAVAARTFAYFIVDDRPSGVIGDGQNDQVFSNIAPSAIHLEAARATEGEILYVRDDIGFEEDVLIAAFYVAGAIPTGPFDPANPSARPAPGTPSLADTEQFVTFTFEEGLFSGFNQGTTLGFQGSVTNPNWPNRGAKRQNGADFFSDNSVSYVDILKYYYGADIQIRTAQTEGTGVEFGPKVITDFDDFGSGSAADLSDGLIAGNEGFFNRSPTFSGSTTANLAGSTAERDPNQPQEGTHSQRIDIVYDESSGEDFLLRHVSGAAFSEFNGQSNAGERVANLQFEAIGRVGFFLRTTDPGLQVSLAIDDPETGDRGFLQEVIADGEWHEYSWSLDDDSQWEAWTAGGNGTVDGLNVSIDSIQLLGATDAAVFLDTVFWDPTVPDPAEFGDFNADGLVDAADYTIWRDNFLQFNDSADADGNGFIGNDDFDIWVENFGFGSAPTAEAVPEPGGVCLIAPVLLAIRSGRRPNPK